MSYTLSVTSAGGAVTNASISSSGVITWTPTEAQAPSTNTFTSIVADNGSPPLSATNTFTVLVNAVLPRPVVAISVSNDLVTLAWNANSGATYRVQLKTNLADPAWLDVVPDIVATGTTATMNTNVGTNSAAFYRVQVVQ